MAIIHVVCFQFRELMTPDEIKVICDAMLALKDNCVHPTSKKPYVKSMMGGIDNSPEGLQDGITHVFVAEFESEEDRKYYLEEDPAHKKFGEGITKVAAKIRVMDFSPGVF